jgi:hypothetical protein
MIREDQRVHIINSIIFSEGVRWLDHPCEHAMADKADEILNAAHATDRLLGVTKGEIMDAMRSESRRMRGVSADLALP